MGLDTAKLEGRSLENSRSARSIESNPVCCNSEHADGVQILTHCANEGAFEVAEMCGTQGRLDRRLGLFSFKRTVLYLPTPSARLLTLPHILVSRPGRGIPPFPRFCVFTTSTHLTPVSGDQYIRPISYRLQPFDTMRRSTRSSSSPHNVPPFYRRAREKRRPTAFPRRNQVPGICAVARRGVCTRIPLGEHC